MESQRLRFAPLIRVSTERQEKQGESLKTQKKQLMSDIKSMKGTCSKWYEGQEHATPDYERIIFDQLIEDAKEKKFDAVIVADTSRWARDPVKSKEALKILRNNGIKFYVRTMPYDLFDSMQVLFLGIKGEMDAYYAKDQAHKSIINRIERAKKGYPSGRPPYGRIFKKDNHEWVLDLEKQKNIETCARLYLDEDKSFDELSEQFKINKSYLHKVLVERSGDKWKQEFKSKHFQIHEVIITKVPRLLPEVTINRIRQKCKDRRTWIHGTQKNEYLLSRMIFDANTGYALSGTTFHSRRYYRTYKKSNSKYSLNASVIEKAVIESLFEAISSNKKFFKAVFEDTPTVNELEELEKKKLICKNELKSIERKIGNGVQKTLKFEGENLNLFIEKMKAEVQQLENKRSKILSEIQCVESMLRAIPTKEDIEYKREHFEKELKDAHNMSRLMGGHVFRELGFEEQRRIIRLIFGGKNQSGKRYGIFIKNVSTDELKKYEFKAYGKLGTIVGGVVEGEECFSYDDDVSNYNGLEDIKKDMRKLMRYNNKEHILSLYSAYDCRDND